jgi:hypothetical protein
LSRVPIQCIQLEPRNHTLNIRRAAYGDFFVRGGATEGEILLVQILFKNPVRTSKRTPHFTITKNILLTPFKNIIMFTLKIIRNSHLQNRELLIAEVAGPFSYHSA